MAFSVKYIPLLNVNILHLFFLNKGLTEYSAMDDEAKARQLGNYNLQSVFSVIPTSETLLKLNGYNLVFKVSNAGFAIWSKVEGVDTTPFIPLEDDLDFTFLLQKKDPVFYNYTGLKMEDAGKLYYLSNRKLASEAASFPLIPKEGGNTKLDEQYILSADGQESELKQLQLNEKTNLFALVRIFMKGDNSSLNVTDAQGKIQNPATVFEIRLDNRKTTWRYIFKTNQQVTGGDDVKKEGGNSKILITKAEQPLTQNGFISIELDGAELPNPGIRFIKPDTINNKYYSEIYM
jgi:hypothetical protein